MTGGTSTVEKISFGIPATIAGSTGTLILNGAAAELYVGTGGIVQGATAAISRGWVARGQRRSGDD